MRFAAGLLLVVAAVLKGAELVNEPAVLLVSPLGQWFLPVQVGVELGLGLAILSGLYWRQLRWIALLVFTAFAAYSLNLAVNGAASCGCFGPVKVHPWWTFSIDVAIALGLLISIVRDRTGPVAKVPPRTPYLVNRPALTALIVGVSVLSSAALIRYVASRTAVASDLLSTTGDLVILEPSQWIGHSLPIADFIDLNLSAGKWIVLFHRHDCPDCQEAVPRYEQLALQQPVALIEVPPYEESHNSAGGAAYRGRLNDDREWFVQTPVEIQLQDGVVIGVKNGHDD